MGHPGRQRAVRWRVHFLQWCAAIILGLGGDNGHGAAGTFYEGVMTSGYPSDATENAVQANIVAARYR